MEFKYWNIYKTFFWDVVTSQSFPLFVLYIILTSVCYKWKKVCGPLSFPKVYSSLSRDFRSRLSRLFSRSCLSTILQLVSSMSFVFLVSSIASGDLTVCMTKSQTHYSSKSTLSTGWPRSSSCPTHCSWYSSTNFVKSLPFTFIIMLQCSSCLKWDTENTLGLHLPCL